MNYNVDYLDFKQLVCGTYDVFIPSVNEMIILVGFPASGKSYYAVNNIVVHGYSYINQTNLTFPRKRIQFS